MKTRAAAALVDAELKAWEALARYKFWMFGYFAARWAFLNGLGGFRRANPFRPLVHVARDVLVRLGKPVASGKRKAAAP
jgi:hypothetical protein